jgi:hypothetical protein
MHCLTHSPTLFSGSGREISTYELHTAINGFLKSSRLTPVAMKSAVGAR